MNEDYRNNEPRDPLGLPELIICIVIAACIVGLLFGASEFAQIILSK